VQNGQTLQELSLTMDYMDEEEERLLNELSLPVLTELSLTWNDEEVVPLPALSPILSAAPRLQSLEME
jgi:hypothetical protein